MHDDKVQVDQVDISWGSVGGLADQITNDSKSEETTQQAGS